ncbi:hypothetical protein [Blastopirellula marina]|uniref:DUF3160 domain-containing protein n=1 Tax=Blastopirellula marina TaxID=124 RepID=A0A2S8GKM4_9BACT|nr:hypothetical protein [Blastopirellula marina]PQO44988.1 hypothetical protein C5Y93_15755 [Blastopirellula marina]
MSPKMKSYLAIFGGGAFLFAGMTGWSSFGPARAVVVSRETTYLEEPLTPDGRVDYLGYILEQRREGVTPENNAAIPIILETWQGDKSNDQIGRLQQELGIEVGVLAAQMPARYGPELDSQISTWAFKKWPVDTVENHRASFNSYAYVSDASNYAWQREAVPPLADWIDQQAPHYEHLEEIDQRDKFYWPAGSWLLPPGERKFAIDNDAENSISAALETIFMRSNMRLGEQDAAGAWRDLQLGWRLTSMYAPVPSQAEIETYRRFQTRLMLQTHRLLSSGVCEPELLDEIAHFFAQYPLAPGVEVACDQYARFRALNSVAYHHKDLITSIERQLPPETVRLLRLPFDKNASLWRVNETYDELQPILKIEDPAQFDAAAITWNDAALERYRSWSSPRALVAAALSQSARGVYLADLTYSGWASRWLTVKPLDFRYRQLFRLMQVAVALEQYRAKEGEYPDSLERLDGVIDKQLTQDMYLSGQSLVYEKRPPGFLLYSRYLRGYDDSGSSDDRNIIEGEWLKPNSDYSYRGDEGYDLVVRYPMPHQFRFEKPRIR